MILIQTATGRQRVKVESVLETEKDGKGGCIFLSDTGKKFFLQFRHFSFIVNPA